jgi:hypothetical protein
MRIFELDPIAGSSLFILSNIGRDRHRRREEMQGYEPF